jgi:hypothetical protein
MSVSKYYLASAYIIERQQIFLSVSKYYLSSASIIYRQQIFLSVSTYSGASWQNVFSKLNCGVTSYDDAKCVLKRCVYNHGQLPIPENLKTDLKVLFVGYGSATKRPKTINRA